MKHPCSATELASDLAFIECECGWMFIVPMEFADTAMQTHQRMPRAHLPNPALRGRVSTFADRPPVPTPVAAPEHSSAGEIAAPK